MTPQEVQDVETVDLSVIVPIFNEEDSVGPLCEAIVAAVAPLGLNYEILLVDDGSSDLTIPRTREIIAGNHHIQMLRFQRNYGQTAAMTAGLDHARGTYLVTMDGDLQNDPADIPAMLEKMQEGYDLVVGWRMNRQDKWLSRKLPSMLANRLIGHVTGLPIRDNGCSLKVYRAEVIKRVPLYSDMHRFIPAMTIPLGGRVAEVGVRHHARRFGASKYGLSRIFKVLLDLLSIKTLLLFARRPLSNFVQMSLGSLLAALLLVLLVDSDAGSSHVVEMAAAGLLVTLSIFLFLTGLMATVAFNTNVTAPPRTDTRDAEDA